MKKMLAIGIFVMACSAHVYGMEKLDLQAAVGAIIKESDVLAKEILAERLNNTGNSVDRWIQLMKNCGKLEFCVKHRMVLNKTEMINVISAVHNLEVAFKTRYTSCSEQAMANAVYVCSNQLELLLYDSSEKVTELEEEEEPTQLEEEPKKEELEFDAFK